MKKLLLIIGCLVLFMNVSFADDEVNYTELELQEIGHNQDTGDITHFTLEDQQRGIEIKFYYYDVLSMTADYTYSNYYYNYENDLLMIIGEDGTLWYDDLNW